MGLTPSILTVHLRQSSSLHWSEMLSGGPSPCGDHDTVESQPLGGSGLMRLDFHSQIPKGNKKM